MNWRTCFSFISIFFTLFSILGMPVLAADDVAITVDVLPFLVVTMNYASVGYSSQTAGSSNIVAPNQATGIYNSSISTNQDFKLEVNATDFADNGNSFGIGNLTADSDPTAGSLALGNSVSLTNLPQTIDTNITLATTIHYHGFWLSIPATQPSGSYSTTATFTYSNV